MICSPHSSLPFIKYSVLAININITFEIIYYCNNKTSLTDFTTVWLISRLSTRSRKSPSDPKAEPLAKKFFTPSLTLLIFLALRQQRQQQQQQRQQQQQSRQQEKRKKTKDERSFFEATFGSATNLSKPELSFEIGHQ